MRTSIQKNLQELIVFVEFDGARDIPFASVQELISNALVRHVHSSVQLVSDKCFDELKERVK